MFTEARILEYIIPFAGAYLLGECRHKNLQWMLKREAYKIWIRNTRLQAIEDTVGGLVEYAAWLSFRKFCFVN